MSCSREYFCRFVEACTMILQSPVLRWLCLHLVCSYIVSSLLYLSRTLVMATSVEASGERLRWFAAMQAYSASIILTLQLTATGVTVARFDNAQSLSDRLVISDMQDALVIGIQKIEQHCSFALLGSPQAWGCRQELWISATGLFFRPSLELPTSSASKREQTYLRA